MPSCNSAVLPQAANALRSGVGAACFLILSGLFAAPSATAQTPPTAAAPADAVSTPAPAAVAPVPAPTSVASPSAVTPAAVTPPVAASSTAEAPAAGPHAAPGAGAGASAPAEPAPPTEVVAPEPALLPHDLSPWGMFMAADRVVKAVMIGLALASVLTWTVWIAKSLELVLAKRRSARTLAALRSAATLVAASRAMPQGRGPASAVVHTAISEWEASEGLSAEGIKERVAIALGRIEAAAGRRMAAGTGLLATIGSIAPFVGLFGTVWGIMNSFIGISKAQTTNLAVVAPGIAEALLATAIGLVAAIPAVVIYNVFARAISAYRARLTDVSAETMRHLSRDLDRATRGTATRNLRAAAE